MFFVFFEIQIGRLVWKTIQVQGRKKLTCKIKKDSLF